MSTDSSCCRRSCLTCWICHHIARFVLLHREYLAIFKKTVAMHEVFLCRVAAHPVLRKDLNFHVFLEYNQDVSITPDHFIFRIYEQLESQSSVSTGPRGAPRNNKGGQKQIPANCLCCSYLFFSCLVAKS